MWTPLRELDQSEVRELNLLKISLPKRKVELVPQMGPALAKTLCQCDIYFGYMNG